MARFLTTRKIAEMVGVSERTVANWIDRNQLSAHRTPGGHRRVSPEDLVGFLRSRQMPIPDDFADAPRILIVEDEPDVARTLESALRHADPRYEVTVIGNGISALLHIGSEKPDLVLLDVMIPGMDGFEVCRKLRASPVCREVSVLFVTAYSDLDPETVMERTGAAGLLRKPVRGLEVAAEVGRLLARAPRNRNAMIDALFV